MVHRFDKSRIYIQSSILIYLLDCLKLHLNLLLKTGFHKTEKIVESDVDNVRVRLDCVQLVNFLPLYLCLL